MQIKPISIRDLKEKSKQLVLDIGANALAQFNSFREWFSLLNVFGQLSIIIVCGFIVVTLSGIVLGSVADSYAVFVDPPALATIQGKETFNLLYSFFLMLLGLILSGFIVSVLNSWLQGSLTDIKNGSLPFRGSEHTLIVNYNDEIYTLLSELEFLHEDAKRKHHVVVLVRERGQVEKILDYLNEKQKEARRDKKRLNTKVHVRRGDALSLQRYRDLSIDRVRSIVIMHDTSIFSKISHSADQSSISAESQHPAGGINIVASHNDARDNYNLRIINLLCTDTDIYDYMKQRKNNNIPVKAVAEFSKSECIDRIVKKCSKGIFAHSSPKEVVQNVLNFSIFEIGFFNLWKHLLSFDGHELYFVPANKYNLGNEQRYIDLVLRQKKGRMIGYCRFNPEKKSLDVFLNPFGDTIKTGANGDYLIVLAENMEGIEFSDSPQAMLIEKSIAQPAEKFRKNILVIGKKRELKIDTFLAEEYKPYFREPDYDDLLTEKFYNSLLEHQPEIDKFIINLDDEKVYRIALFLYAIYGDTRPELLEQFVFLVDDSVIADHLNKVGFKSVILSHLLSACYLAQISNQLSLRSVYEELFKPEGAEINLISREEIAWLLNEPHNLNCALAHNKMTYIGIVKNDGGVEFNPEENDVRNASKIIVLSDGEE